MTIKDVPGVMTMPRNARDWAKFILDLEENLPASTGDSADVDAALAAAAAAAASAASAEADAAQAAADAATANTNAQTALDRLDFEIGFDLD